MFPSCVDNVCRMMTTVCLTCFVSQGDAAQIKLFGLIHGNEIELEKVSLECSVEAPSARRGCWVSLLADTLTFTARLPECHSPQAQLQYSFQNS
ncbi:hypothetical protein NQZ68_015728 [Dissostichus eleginoides]|nr:hypothetical protein NQZ68_015728 [Dissostichus eleginoides]